MVISNTGLGKKDIHVPGHPPCDRVDCELYLNVPALEQVSQFLDLLLGLGNRHAIPGSDDYLVRIGKHDCDIICFN